MGDRLGLCPIQSTVHRAPRPRTTSLHDAVMRQDTASVLSLLKTGADPSIRSCVNVRTQNNCLRTWHEQPLAAAVRAGHPDMVRTLLQHSADPDQQTVTHERFGSHALDKTALELAVERNHSEIVHILLDYNASVHVLNRSGVSVLYTAVRCTGKQHCDVQTTIVRLLCEHGVDINYSGKSDLSPLQIATNYKCFNKVQLLLLYGANPNPCIPDPSEYTTQSCKSAFIPVPLHCAVTLNNVRMTNALVEFGADLNATDQRGLTALHKVITQWGDCSIATSLIQHGIDVNLQAAEAWYAADCKINVQSTMSMLVAYTYLDCETLGQGLIAANYNLEQDKEWLDEFENSYQLSDNLQGSLLSERLQTFIINLLRCRKQVKLLTTMCRNLIRLKLTEHEPKATIFPSIERLPVPQTIKKFLSLC